MARDIRDKGGKDRQVLFAATLSFEAKRHSNLLREEAEAALHRRQEGSLEITVRPGCVLSVGEQGGAGRE